MRDTERYLKQATRGLWSKEKQALRTELTGHIRLRVNELMLTGLNETEAERQTLRELGAPQEVSRGMASVYALNTAVKGSLVTCLLACTAFLTVQQVQAQVSTVYDMPKSNVNAGAYLDLNQLRQEVKKAGAEITGDQNQLMLNLPGMPRPDFPVYASEHNLFTRDGKTLISAGTFIMTLMNTGADVQLKGWNNPTINASGHEIKLQTNDWRVLNDLYGTTLSNSSALSAYSTMLVTPFDPIGSGQQVSVSNSRIQKGHIYALVVPQFNVWSMTRGVDKIGGTILLVTNTVQATQDGQVQFRTYKNTLPFKFVNDEDALHRALGSYLGKLSGWNEKKPAPALLLELTGKFGQDAYKVIPPSAWK